jgi:endonuclease/exonuclease/phosphatase family metal-dependent hydrolase
MATKVRIATFNCENLFSRAKILNFRNHDKVAGLLTLVEELEGLLAKATYTPADKKRILELANALASFVTIAEDRGKLFTGTGANRRVSASGSGAWDGHIEFKREPFDQVQRETTAKVINETHADVQCLVEAEDRPAIDAFNAALAKPRFEQNMLIDGFDPRGIDVGLLTRHRIVSIRTHIFDRDSVGPIFSRDCLEVELEVKKGLSLFLFINHFKSQGFGKPADNDAKRLRQARRVRDILKQYDLASSLVVVAGDFNAAPDHPSLAPLVSMKGLSDVLALQFADAKQRWTYHFKKNEQIDFILVSDALKAKWKASGVERRGMPDLAKHTVSGEVPFPEVKGFSTSASDHALVWADFVI